MGDDRKDPRYRSGEVPAGDLSGRYSGDTSQIILLQQLVKGLDGMKNEMSRNTDELRAHKEVFLTQRGEINTKLARLELRMDDAGKQLDSLWGKHEQTASAWVGVVPTVVATIVGSLLTSAIVGGLVYALTKAAVP